MRGRIYYGKTHSIIGMIMGIVFIFIGIFEVIPLSAIGNNNGSLAFGVFWTLTAVAITFVFGWNAFSNKKIPIMGLEFESGDNEDFDSKIRKLAKLNEDGLITAEEFEKKRAELMKEKW